MTDVELRDELMTMLLAGHETTATGLAFAFDLLLHNPAVLDRLRDELDGGDDAYLDAVVTETLRLRPVIDATERTLKAPRTVAGWELPAGHPRLPGDRARPPSRGPLPERRGASGPSASSRSGAESYSWLPFGGGIRRCIGAASPRPRWPRCCAAVLSAVELEPACRARPVVMRGITLVPRHGAGASPLAAGGRRDRAPDRGGRRLARRLGGPQRGRPPRRLRPGLLAAHEVLRVVLRRGDDRPAISVRLIRRRRTVPRTVLPRKFHSTRSPRLKSKAMLSLRQVFGTSTPRSGPAPLPGTFEPSAPSGL